MKQFRKNRERHGTAIVRAIHSRAGLCAESPVCIRRIRSFGACSANEDARRSLRIPTVTGPNVGRFVAADFDFMILPNRLSAIRGGPRKSLGIVSASRSWTSSFCQFLGELSRADRKNAGQKISTLQSQSDGQRQRSTGRAESCKILCEQNHGGQNHPVRSRSTSLSNWIGAQSIQDFPARRFSCVVRDCVA